MRLPVTGTSRDACAVMVVGIAVSAAPLVWYPLVWPDQPAFGAWAWVFGISLVPFLALALVRQTAVMGRAAAFIALLLCGGLVVLGQVAGLDPTDPSSTASIALVLLPMYACVAVGVVLGVEAVVKALRPAPPPAETWSGLARPCASGRRSGRRA